jgi:hypothetical protein
MKENEKKEFNLDEWRKDCFDRIKKGEVKIVFGQSEIGKKYLERFKNNSKNSEKK